MYKYGSDLANGKAKGWYPMVEDMNSQVQCEVNESPTKVGHHYDTEYLRWSSASC